MKKLVILLLLWFPAMVLAQEYVKESKVENDIFFEANTNSTMTLTTENYMDVASSTPEDVLESSILNNRIYVNSNSGMIFEEPAALPNSILTADEETSLGRAMLTFTKDGKTVFFSVNRRIKNKKDDIKTKKAVHLQLFKARVKDDGTWVDLEMLPFNSNHHSTGQPFLNHDDSKLYFVSDGPESLGRTDIFVVDLHEDGTYGDPVNLGPDINSPEREIFPFLSQENFLYFASDAENKWGELDPFASKIFDTTVSKRIKLEGPLNVVEDDFDFSIDDEDQLMGLPPVAEAEKGVGEVYSLVDDIVLEVDCDQMVSGVVRDMTTQELLPNVELVLFDKEDNKIQATSSDASDASFNFEQSCNSSYVLRGFLNGYAVAELEIATVNDLNATPMNVVLVMREDQHEAAALVANGDELDDTSGKEAVDSAEADKEVSQVVETAILQAPYDFNSDAKVYTVQVGAYKGKAQAGSFSEVTNLFNHQYEDGLNRYFSGVFESHAEATKYKETLQKSGYQDAFVVGLLGEQRL